MQSREESELRSAVQFSVIQVCSKRSTENNNSNNSNNRGESGTGRTTAKSASAGASLDPRAIVALSELTYLYASTCLSSDLQAFSDHAGRKKTVTDADVMLVARKLPDGLHQELQRFRDGLGDEKPSAQSAVGGVSTNAKRMSERQKQASDVLDVDSDSSETSTDFSDENDVEDAFQWKSKQATSSSYNKGMDDVLLVDDNTTDDDSIGASRDIEKPKTTTEAAEATANNNNSATHQQIKPATKKFRLSNPLASPETDDSSSVDLIPTNKKRTDIQNILDNMSMDSVPSDYESNKKQSQLWR